MDDDLLQRMKKDRDAIADIMKEIPLLREYVENSSLWEADRIIRQEAARRLDGLKGPVNDAVRDASGDIRAGDRLAALEALLTGIDAAANAVRVADYGHSALTAKVKIKPSDLERLLAHDRGMISVLDEAESAAASLAAEGPENLKAALDRFRADFESRNKCLVESADRGDKEE